MSQSSTADADADADDNGDNADEGEEGAMMDGPCFYCESDAHASCDCPHRRPDDPPLSQGVGSGGGWKQKAQKLFDSQRQQRNDASASLLNQTHSNLGVGIGGGSNSNSALINRVREAAGKYSRGL